MTDYELTKEDINNLKKLFIITEKIKLIYDELCNLEIKEKMDSLDYDRLLYELDEVFDEEDELYEKLTDNPLKINEILKKYFKIEVINTVEMLNYARNNSFLELVTSRIGKKLEYILTNTKFNELDEVFEEDEFEERPNMEDVERQFEYMASLEDNCELDILNTILAILNNYILDDDFISIRPILIRFKYLLSFSFELVDQSLLRNKFEIQKDLYWCSKLILDSYGGNPRDLNLILAGFSEDILYEQSDNLTSLIFQDLHDINNYAKAIMSEIIIRACLLFSSSKTILGFKDFIIGELKDSKVDNKMIEVIINRAINNISKDEELPRKLSLKI